MTDRRLRTAALSLILLASGCVSAPDREPVVTAKPSRAETGLEGVIGQNARNIEALLGRAALDVREGTARKLQFANSVCVLDAYLYPPRQGAEAVVTHVDARLPDGRDMDRVSCLAALTGPPRAR